MKRKLKAKAGGVNRAVVLLLVLIGVMLVVIAIPAWNAFRYDAERVGCVQAMKSAGDGLIIEYLGRMKESSVKEAQLVLDEVMPGRDVLCPAGGTVYLVLQDNGIYKPVCGLHDDDFKEKTRLNASYALELLTDGLRKERRVTEGEPESVTIVINGKELECKHVTEEEPLRRGTANTKGYEGVVAYYGLAGDDAFASDTDNKAKISYFLYADENHCAVWRADDGWTGDSYNWTP